MDALSRELSAEQEALEKAKRECNALDEAQRTCIAQLRDELAATRAKEEEQK